MILNIITDKYQNNGNFQKKFKAKKKRLGIEDQVQVMKKQINLMQIQAGLIQKNLKLEELNVKKKKDVKVFKDFLAQKKMETVKRLEEANQARIKENKMLSSMTQQNKLSRMTGIYNDKKNIVETTKQYFSDAIKTKSEGRIKQIILNKKLADKVRVEEYQSKIKRLEYIKSKYFLR